MGKSQRNKGADFERQVAKYLQEWGFEDAHRTAQRSGKSGDAADVVGLPGIHIECKAVEQPHFTAWLDQADRDSAGTKNIPVVVWKMNRKPWLAIMRIEPFLAFRKRHRIQKEETAFQMHASGISRMYLWMLEAKEKAAELRHPRVPAVLWDPFNSDEKLVVLYMDDFMRLYTMHKGEDNGNT